jgi:hypothetical protein
MEEHRRGHAGRIVALVLNLALITLAIWVYFNRLTILDEIELLNYHPTADIQALADKTTMTTLSKRYFYASRPTIDNRQTFNTNCHNTDEKTIILGCYSGGSIHVFDVTDSRLPVVREVTAAHEMLHAAYVRLSDQEKNRINNLIEQQLKSMGADEHIQSLINSYNRTEPGELNNEMHSILGTEIRGLSPDLEQYYQRYFTNRTTVVAYAASYQTVFSNLQSQQKLLLDDLNSLADQINKRTVVLNEAVKQLNDDVAIFNTRASDGTKSLAQFNAERNTLISRLTDVQTERTMIGQLVATYNQKRDQLNSLNLQAQSLDGSINSSLDPVTTLN